MSCVPRGVAMARKCSKQAFFNSALSLVQSLEADCTWVWYIYVWRSKIRAGEEEKESFWEVFLSLSFSHSFLDHHLQRKAYFEQLL